METVGPVQFRNVGCSYFPESRVDCHYTLGSQHSWASSDWIGLFKVSLPGPTGTYRKSTRSLCWKEKTLLDKLTRCDLCLLFLPQAGWSSVRDYHTFVWALAPADYEEGSEVNCCVQFQGTELQDCFYSLFPSVLCNRGAEVRTQSCSASD